MKRIKGTFKIIMKFGQYFLVLENEKHALPMLELTKEEYEALENFWRLGEK
jgi:galactose-1-phosphate uridylyltransferase